MKLCKKGLHNYDTKQCMQCEKAWRKANKEYIYEKNKIWREENKHWYNEIKNSSETKKASVKAWKKANRARCTALQMKREACKLQRTPKWLTKTHYNQIQIFYDAAFKLTKEFGTKMDVDHIIPLQGRIVSGLHVPWNLQVLPHMDNMKKGNRL